MNLPTFRSIPFTVMVALVAVGCGDSTLPPSQNAAQPLDPTTSTLTVPISEVVTPSSDASSSTDLTEDAKTPSEVATTLAQSAPPTGAEPAIAPEWEDVTGNLVGLQSSCGNLSYVSAQPGQPRVIAGVSQNGLWELTDTDSWTQLGVGFGSEPITNRTSWIEYDPLLPDRFWESGTYAETGVHRTDDGGVTFRPVGDISHIDHVSVDPTDPFRATVLAGGHEARALYKSVDGGQVWNDISGALPPEIGFTSFPVVIDPLTHLLGTLRGEASGIFRTEDGGLTWTTVHVGAVAGPPLIVEDRIYWLRANGGGLLVSRDGGRTFEASAGAIGGSPSSLSLLPDGRLATYNEAVLVVSADEGASWFPFGPRLPFRAQGMAFSAERSAFYVWQFTCDFSGVGNPVIPRSIMRLQVDPETS